MPSSSNRSVPSIRAAIECLENRVLLAGDFDFAAAVGAAGADAAKYMCTDRNGNVYVTGTFSGQVDFDPGAGTYTMNAVGAKDFFVAKYAADHSFVWARQVGGSGDEMAGGVFVDKPGNVYVTGGFTGTADFYPGKRILNLTSNGLLDIFAWKLDSTGALVWAKSVGGASSDWGTGITLDAAGNVYIAGGFKGILDLDPGAATYFVRSLGGRDALVWELTGAGNFVMARSVGGSGEDFANAVAIDRLNDIWLSGYYTGTGDFDPGKGVLNYTAAGGTDIFHLELSPRVKLMNAWSMGGTGNDVANAMTVDRTGNIYTVGSFSGTADFNPSARRKFNVTSAGGSDGFLSILTSAGGVTAAKALGGAGNDAANAIALDSAGSLYVGGAFEQSADLSGSGAASFTSAGASDSYVAKFTSLGQFAYGRTGGGAGADAANGVAIYGTEVFSAGSISGTANLDPKGTANFTSAGGTDGYVLGLTQTTPDLGFADKVGTNGAVTSRTIATGADGSTYVAGTFIDSVDFDPNHTDASMVLTSNGGDDVFIEKLDASGNIVWVRSLGGTGDETARAIAVNAAGEVYVTGNFQATVDFNTAADTYNVTATGTYDGYVLKLDANGDSMWVDTMGGAGATVLSNGLALDSDGFVYVGGGFTDTVDFSVGDTAHNLTSAGSSDIFAMNLAADGSFLWVRGIGGTDYDVAWTVGVNPGGDVFAGGQFAGTVDFDFGSGTDNITATGDSAAFVTRITTQGDYAWTAAFIGDQDSVVNGIAVDGASAAYATGDFTGTTNFNPTGSLDKTSEGNEDIFAVKLDATGAEVWTYTAGGAGHDIGWGVALDGLGNTLLAGSFTDTATFDTGVDLTSGGVEDIFVAKVNSAGTLVWGRSQGGAGSDLAFGITSGAGGAFAHVTGQFTGPANFDLSGGSATLAGTDTTSFVERIVQ